MSMPSGKSRQRAWKPKNRTGCKTCKIRKVKCDEEKPHCKRCTSTGRTCDGYDASFRPTSNSPSTSPPAQAHLQPSRELTRSRSPVPLAPALNLKTAQERDSFDFFITHAISSLRGFLDSPFWQREILQAAHHHESIRHCLIALGAMHRRFYDGGNSHIEEADLTDQHLQFALRQSNQAIQGLVRATSRGSNASGENKVTLMACSVLFSSMACLQGHQKEGLQHLRSGLRMLHEVDQEENDGIDGHAIDVESLRSIFVGLDMQARSIMTTADSGSWEPTPRTKEPFISPNTDLNANSLLALQQYLQALLNRTLAFLQASLGRSLEEGEDVYHGYCRLLARFDHGTKLLEELSAKAAYSTNDFTQSLTSLQLLHSQLEYFMRSPRPDLEAKFDFMTNPFEEPFDSSAHFTKMLDLATKLLLHGSSLSPVFTTTSGPLQALYLIAARAPSQCHDLRKRAAKLMLSYPRREGFWDGLVAGQIAQEMLRLEQESAQKELGLSIAPSQDLIVPKELRIIVVALSYDENNDRKARVEYRNAREMADGVPGRVQYVTW
ncbi:hypothetical protein CC86DRAFT_394266 [Ophiobolus disseminans]|uniref:Zn(2)-C6 fungal-type domain-containing protein n=1 Tax=Ophiobolus disseminans TaxID=1469910 RepID=A0A6A6ZZF8_9PLEO|nr:hypothetical protein CC86DRAFT_394266 [Ophiobolus disseminans]